MSVLIVCLVCVLHMSTGLPLAKEDAAAVDAAAAAVSEASLWQPGNCSREEWVCNMYICDEHVAKQRIGKCAELRKIIGREFMDAETKLSVEEGDCNDSGCVDDMLLDDHQLDFLIQEAERAKRKKRRIRKDFPTANWPMPIPFMIDGSIAHHRRVILEAIAMWSNATCITFREHGVTEVLHTTYTVFMASASYYLTGCQSFIGKITEAKAQPIILAPSCMTPGVIAHEIGHLLGFVHEHQRPDRDDYIKVNVDNIMTSKFSFFQQFDKNHVTTLDVPYDYTSDMHYKARSYSKNSGRTIETKDPQYQSSIGQRVELSFYDILLANKAYCPSTCASHTQLSCTNSGYMDPHDCSRCRCPDGWGGVLCDGVAPSKGAPCGGELSATSNMQYITSPQYEQNIPYQLKQECYWLIKAPRGRKVALSFLDEFGVYCYQERCTHWVEIKFSSNLGMYGRRFCCDKTPDVELTSEGEQMLVIFKAKDTFASVGDRRGFKLQFIADGNECENNPCQNGAVCIDGVGVFTCACKDGFTGKLCEQRDMDFENMEFNIIAPIDLGILIDAKDRPGKDFSSMKHFMADFISRFDVGGDQTQVGVISFHEYAERRGPFSPRLGNSDISPLISDISTSSISPGYTNYFAAMWFMTENLYSYLGGERLDVMNIAVMIVDNPGYSWLTQALFARQKRSMEQQGIHLIIVCVGQAVDLPLMQYLASSTDSVVIVDKYSDLYEEHVMNELLAKVQEQNYKVAANDLSDPTSLTTTTTSTTKKPTTTTKKPTTTTTKKPTTTTTTKKPTTTTKKPTTTTTTTKKPTTTTTTTTTKKPTTTTSTTTTTTPIPAASTTTAEIFRERCWYDRAECDHECGGCGRRKVQHRCEVSPGKFREGWAYHEGCNLDPCDATCTKYIGKLYTYPCKKCCSGYQLIEDRLCVRQ